MPSPEKFKRSLETFCVDENVISQIYEGYEDIVDKAPKKTRAAFFKRAVDIMTEQVEMQQLQAVFEWNACCKSGAREKVSKSFAKENGNCTIEQKLEKIKDIPYMGQPSIDEQGIITVNAVSYSNGAKYLCACPNFNGAAFDDSVSKNYCFCCAGHFRHHYEIMLGVKLKTLEIVSSPLDSNGNNPCMIRFEIVRCHGEPAACLDGKKESTVCR